MSPRRRRQSRRQGCGENGDKPCERGLHRQDKIRTREAIAGGDEPGRWRRGGQWRQAGGRRSQSTPAACRAITKGANVREGGRRRKKGRGEGRREEREREREREGRRERWGGGGGEEREHLAVAGPVLGQPIGALQRHHQLVPHTPVHAQVHAPGT